MLGEDRRLALVTGGASGIGLAVREQLADDGFDVVSLDPAHAGTDPAGLPVSVTEEAALEAAIEKVASRYGRLDALVLAAGVKVRGTLPDLGTADWDACFDLNVRGVFLSIKHAMPWLGRGSSVVTFGSASAHAEAGALAYSASKGAVLSLTRSLAIDLMPAGIRVNAVLPGFTQTPMAAELDPAARRAKESENVAGRLNTAVDVARAVSFLVSAAAATISGTVLDVAHVQGAFVSPAARSNGSSQ